MGFQSRVPAPGAPNIRTRRDEAFAFIREYLIERGHSPTMQEIANALGVKKTRAQTLVGQLATLGLVQRPAGSVRAIHIPNLERERAIAVLRSQGVIVDEDVFGLGAGPKGPLPLIAVIEHIPHVDDGKTHGQPPHA